MRSLLCALVLVVALVGATAGAQPPADPAGLTRVTLDSGLEVWVMPLHPPRDGSAGVGEVGLSLMIPAGSLDEDEDQLGAAYLAKRAVGFGTAHADVAALGAMRSGFGGRDGVRGEPIDPTRGDHGLTGYESTVFSLVFDAGDGAGWDAALGHFADLLSGWKVDAALVERLRPMAEERRGETSPENRARRLFMPDLMPGARLGVRDIIPDAQTLASTDADDVQRFVAARYRPRGSVLVVVGDIDPGEALRRASVALGRERVGDLGAPPRPAWLIASQVGGRVSVHAVEGYKPAEVSLLSVEALAGVGGDPEATRVLDDVAGELIGVRARRAAATSEPGVVSVDVHVSEWLGATRIAEVSVRLPQEGMDACGRAVAGELARLREGGFTPDEGRAARASVLARLEGEARHAPDPDALRDSLVNAASIGGVWVSPADRLAHAARTLAATTDADLKGYLSRLLDPDRLACILLGADAGSLPDNDDAHAVLAAARRPGPAIEAPPERLAPLGEGGSVASVSNDARAGVWTGGLDNGVVVRVRPMTTDRVLVRVTLCDGVPREDARTSGRTRDAVAAWAFPRVGSSGAGVVRDWAMERGLSYSFEARADRVVLSIEGGAGSGEAALELARALLARPGVDPDYAGRAQGRDPDFGPGVERLGELMFQPGDPRGRRSPVTESVDPRLADAWLAVLARAPVEVSVVGDVSPERVLDASAQTLGTLAPRGEPSRERARPWGDLPRGESVERITASVEQGEVVTGVVFGDSGDMARVRPMLVASYVLDAEFKRMAQAGDLPGHARAWVWLGESIPGRAMLVVRGACEPADADRLSHAVDEAMERLAGGQIGDEAVQAQIDRAVRGVGSVWERPEFWADRLCGLASSGLDVSSLAGMREDYGAITPRRVRAVVGEALGAGVHRRVIVTPE